MDFLKDFCHCLSNAGTTSAEVSSGFMLHRSFVSNGFLNPSQAIESNQAKNILERNEADCSGHGLLK